MKHDTPTEEDATILNEWTEDAIEQLNINGAEENQTREYKASGALDKKNPKRKEDISKDVSAMANGAGGVIIYGMKEKDNLPDGLDPITRSDISREWLEQVINSNIEPRIPGLLVEPVPIKGHPDQVIYVVVVPASTTAHQASDDKYYRRYNFQCQPMRDHEIRDVMNRATTANLRVEFHPEALGRSGEGADTYQLVPVVHNDGPILVENLRLLYVVPGLVTTYWGDDPMVMQVVELEHKDHITATGVGRDENGRATARELQVVFRGTDILFPCDKVSPPAKELLRYCLGPRTLPMVLALRKQLTGQWTLWADNMLPMRGEISFLDLHRW